MSVVLPARLYPVVAAEAVTRHTVVVEIRRPPGVGRMATLAAIVTCNVVRTLSASDRAVVAGKARARDLRMIDPRGRLPRRHTMAGFTRIARSDVSRILPGCACAVVAREAIPSDARMIERCRSPCGALVAGLAACRRRDVSRRLSLRLNVVVA